MGIELTFLGHSGFILQGGDTRIAIDPFLSGNPVATMRADEVKVEHIVLTHGHEDHVGDTEAIAKSNGSTIYAAYELATFFGEHGISAAKLQPGNPGGRIKTDFGYVAFTRAFHSSSYQGRYMGMPCGCVIELHGVRVYHCGDTDLFSDMRLIGEIHRPDIALIPVGDRFTMGPELGRRAAELIRPKVAVPIHYGTWPLLTSDISTFKPSGVEVKVMEAGQRWRFD